MWGPTDYITFLILTPFLLITLSVLIALLLIWLFFKNHARSIQRFVLKNVFSDIFKEEQKADGSGETVFLLKGIDLAADKETLSKTLNGFSLSLVMLAYVVGTMFWQLLLLEVSHSCDENDTTRVCFERIAGKVGPHDSVNCSSPAVQKGPSRLSATNLLSILEWPQVQAMEHSSFSCSSLMWSPVEFLWLKQQEF